jgi:Ca2+-binding RTX toxin-like protein
VYAGPGNDNLSTGDGNTLLSGGPGRDKLYAGNGRARLFGGSGSDRLFSRAVITDAYCGSGKRNVAYVPKLANNVAFARSHGCQRVIALRIKRR